MMDDYIIQYRLFSYGRRLNDSLITFYYRFIFFGRFDEFVVIEKNLQE